MVIPSFTTFLWFIVGLIALVVAIILAAKLPKYWNLISIFVFILAGWMLIANGLPIFHAFTGTGQTSSEAGSAPMCYNKADPTATDPNTGKPLGYEAGQTMEWGGKTYTCTIDLSGKAVFQPGTAKKSDSDAPQTESGSAKPAVKTAPQCITVPAMTGKGIVPNWQVAWNPYDVQRTGNGVSANYDLHSGLYYLAVGTVYGKTGIHLIFEDPKLGDGHIVTATFKSAEIHQTVDEWTFDAQALVADGTALTAYKANEHNVASHEFCVWTATGNDTATPGIEGITLP